MDRGAGRAPGAPDPGRSTAGGSGGGRRRALRERQAAEVAEAGAARGGREERRGGGVCRGASEVVCRGAGGGRGRAGEDSLPGQSAGAANDAGRSREIRRFVANQVGGAGDTPPPAAARASANSGPGGSAGRG